MFCCYNYTLHDGVRHCQILGSLGGRVLRMKGKCKVTAMVHTLKKTNKSYKYRWKRTSSNVNSMKSFFSCRLVKVDEIKALKCGMLKDLWFDAASNENNLMIQ